MFLLTVDRVFAVTTPLRYRVTVTNKRVFIANCACWIYFIVFGIAFLVLRDLFAIMGAVYNFQLLFMLLGMLAMYVMILNYFHRYSKERAEGHSLRDRNIIMQREKDLFKAISVVVCAFLICYMPWLIVSTLIYFCKACHPHLPLLMVSLGFSGSLTCANSGLNPFLHTWRLPKYRETLLYFWRQLILKKGKANKSKFMIS